MNSSASIDSAELANGFCAAQLDCLCGNPGRQSYFDRFLTAAKAGKASDFEAGYIAGFRIHANQSTQALRHEFARAVA